MDFMNFFDMFNGGKTNAAESQIDSLNGDVADFRKAATDANAYIDPFYAAGKGQLDPYMQNMGAMLDPKKFYADMMSGYQMSPNAQTQMKYGTDSAMAAANASGMRGSSNLLGNVNATSQNIANQDMQQYFQNLMGIHGQGFGAQGNMVNMGFGAGGQMGGNIMNAANMQAQLSAAKAQAEASKSQGQAGDMMNMLNMGMSAAPYLMML